MRTFAKMALSVAVVAMAASVSMAQRQPGGRGGMGQPEGPMLLANKSVQEELKISDDQKKELTTLQEKMREGMTKAFTDNKDDKDARTKAMKEVTDDATKSFTKVADGLKDDQKKRFKQIQVQVKGIKAFEDEDVAKSLKLTDKQKDDAKAKADELDKDRRAIMQELGRQATAEQRAEATKKVADMTTKATDSVISSLSDDQKKTWKELTGDKFDYKPDAFGGRGPGKGDKGKTDKSF